MYLNLKEAAYKAGVHENTARFYRDKYEDYFPYTGEGRYRKYAPATIEILKTIKQCYDAGMEADAIRERLSRQYGIPVHTTEMAVKTPQEEMAFIVVERLKNTMQQAIEETLEKQSNIHAQQIEEFKKEIHELKEQIAQQNHNNETRDKELMQKIREIQQTQKENENKKPWWKIWAKQK